MNQNWLASRYNEKFPNGPANAKDQEKFLKNKVENFEKEKDLYLALDYEQREMLAAAALRVNLAGVVAHTCGRAN